MQMKISLLQRYIGSMVRFVAVLMLLALAQGALGAADEPSAPDEVNPADEANAADEVNASEAVAAERERLLDEKVNYLEVLREQWSEARVDDLYGQYFGLLTEDASVQPVTLQQSIALALQNNTKLKISRLDPVLASNEVRRARSVFDPVIFAGAGKSRSKEPLSSSSAFTAAGNETFLQNVNWDVGIRKALISGGSISFDWTNDRLSRPPNIFTLLVPEYSSELNLSLNQPLLRNFGWRYALLNVDVAKNVEESAFFDYRARVADLVSTVEARYWTLVLAIENVKVEEQGLELARELLRQNQGRFDVGALPRTAVLESEAEVARREANLVRAKNLARIARDILSKLINTRGGESEKVELLEPIDEPSLTVYEIDPRRSLENALIGRPELIAARLNVTSRGLAERAAQNQLLPRLDLVAAFGLNGLGGSDAGPFPTNQPLNETECGILQGLGLDQLAQNECVQGVISADPRVDNGYADALKLLGDGRYYQYNFGVQLEIPLNNAAAKAAYTESKIGTRRARLNLRELEETVTVEIKNAIDNVRSDLKSIEATRVASALAEENLRNQKARYDVGLATTKDLIDFAERLTRARQAEIQALTSYNTDLAELRRVDGSLLDYRNVQLRRADPEDAPWWARF